MGGCTRSSCAEIGHHRTKLCRRTTVDELYFSVGSVPGFYSAWSPSIFAGYIKVLADQEVELLPDLDFEPPRLATVKSAELCINRRLEFSTGEPAQRASVEVDELPNVEGSVRKRHEELTTILRSGFASMDAVIVDGLAIYSAIGQVIIVVILGFILWRVW
jgi:hypothetical protein